MARQGGILSGGRNDSADQDELGHAPSLTGLFKTDQKTVDLIDARLTAAAGATQKDKLRTLLDSGYIMPGPTFNSRA